MALSVDLGTLKATKVTGQVMTAAKMDALNAIGQPATVVPVSYKGAKLSGSKLSLTLPAKSVVVVELQ